ncbi:MAG: RES family NAD+ phosphorylase [Thermoanaerobaculia bacterium]|nr:RES family NAD+ phosphorylase [Thermoanaerobaculia bacterium]
MDSERRQENDEKRRLPLHPEPENLSDRKLPFAQEPPTCWFRFHKPHRDALHFGKSSAFRFDDPEGVFGVLYVAAEVRGAFAETFLGDLVAARYISHKGFAERILSEVRCREPLRLVDLTGKGANLLGADSRLHSTGDRVTQRWSQALYLHPETPDGILYRSRIDDSCLCAAIFDRDPSRFSSTATGSLLESHHSATLRELAELYQLCLLGDS